MGGLLMMISVISGTISAAPLSGLTLGRPARRGALALGRPLWAATRSSPDDDYPLPRAAHPQLAGARRDQVVGRCLSRTTWMPLDGAKLLTELAIPKVASVKATLCVVGKL